MLPKRILGRTKLEVSAISLGALPLQRCTFPEAQEVLTTALAQGINFIDTARAYTDSEQKIGQFLSSRRNEFFLATKSMARSYQAMCQDIDTSLAELQTNYIDLYQIHNAKLATDLQQVLAPEGALKALKEAKLAGKIGHIGITGHSVEILKQAVQTGEFDTVQVPYNFIEQTAAQELFPLARAQNMGIIIMKPLGGGQISQVELSLRFILQQPDVVLIPGMDTAAQVQQNLQVLQPYQSLTASELAKLQAEADIVGKTFCRRCGYCLPCVKGIDIPQIFIFKIQYERYGLKAAIPQRYNNLAVKASACIGCGVCEKRCPYDIPIRQRLQEMRQLMEV